MRQHLGRMVERAGRALDEPVRDLAGIRMLTGGTERQLDLAVERERFRDRVRAIGRVDGVADDFEAVRVGHIPRPPRGEMPAVAVEDDDRRVPPLKHIDAVLIVGRDPADEPERLAVGRFDEIADDLVGVFASTDLCHCRLPP
jgi:hypothetical protein